MFLADFQMEMISQTTIVHYIEYQFERELEQAKKYLNIKIPEKLYDNNSGFMENLIAECDLALDRINQSYFSPKPIPAIVEDVDIREPIGQAIEYCVEALKEGFPLSAHELKLVLEETDDMNGDEEYNFSDDTIGEILSAAQVVFEYHTNSDLHEQEIAIEALKTSIKLVDVSSLSNIFRQSFINVFSIFDAYIFEKLKRYFYQNPQELVCFLDIKNNEKVKVSIDEVLPFANIEELKENMVNKQFDGKYLSEIIKKIKNYKPEVFCDVDYSNLMEMVERRNIHLHNKGHVDSKYCSSFNIYRLSVGEYACINNEYLFAKVFNTLSQFTANIEQHFSA